MSQKRKDNKGRVLRTGESQRQDGRYVYKYMDAAGKARYIYSWRLEATDKLPAGKRDELPLRAHIRQIQRDLEAGINPYGNETTVLELVERYIAQKTGVRYNTQVNYRFVLNILKKERFAALPIDKVRLSIAKAWLIQLQQDGRGYSTIHCVRGVVRPAFQMAVEDDLLRKNPFDFQLSTIVVNDSATRDAISKKQERNFLAFIKSDKHYRRYYDGIYILLNTGLRVSEFAGLTMNDLDMKARTISVNCQLQRTRNMTYVLEEPKTQCGKRVLPMSEEVYQCFRRIIAERKAPDIEPMVGTKSGFLYLDKNEKPMVALHWEHYFKRICEKYNGIYKVPLPNITPHVCRHTYCSNMAKSGMNPKTLQYLMGHSNIGITLDTYTHWNFEDAKADFQRLRQEK